jgi:hypothetical protein
VIFSRAFVLDGIGFNPAILASSRREALMSVVAIMELKMKAFMGNTSL